MSHLTLKNITYQDDSSQYPSTTNSKIEDIDKEQRSDYLWFIWIKRKPLKDLKFSRILFETDLSSIRPRFEIKNETFFTQKDIKKNSFEECILEYDVIVRLPPKKKYTMQMNIESRKKGILKIVEPEEFL